jgi:hypothetical protein
MVLKGGCDLAQQAARIKAFDFFEVSGWKVRDFPCGTDNTKTNRYNNPDRGGDGEPRLYAGDKLSTYALDLERRTYPGCGFVGEEEEERLLRG